MDSLAALVIARLAAGSIPGHMGDLHPFEQAIVVVLAFGPVLLLAATVFIVRRRDAGEEPDHGTLDRDEGV